MFFEAHRLSVFHRRASDVDVVLDLMIHDLDIVLSFVRSPVRQLHAVGLRILSSQVDIATVRLEFASGCVANFTASRVSTETVRKLRFFQPHQYLSMVPPPGSARHQPRPRRARCPEGPGGRQAGHRGRRTSAAGDHVFSGLGSDPKAATGQPSRKPATRGPRAPDQSGNSGPRHPRLGLPVKLPFYPRHRLDSEPLGTPVCSNCLSAPLLLTDDFVHCQCWHRVFLERPVDGDGTGK